MIQVLELIAIPILSAIILILLLVLLAKKPGKMVPFRRDSYVEGLKYLADGDETRALRSLRSAISEDPDNVDTFLKLGCVLRRMGYFDKALQIDQQLTVRPHLRKATRKEVYWGLAQDYIGLGKLDKAISLLKELISFDRRDRRVLKAVLGLYEKKERWDEALDTRKRISDLEGGEDSSLLALYSASVGAKLVERGDLRGGASLLKQALKIDPDCVPALLWLGDSLQEKGETEDAIASWRKIVDEVPEFAFLAFDRLEKAYFDEGRFGEIVQAYEAILEKEPRNMQVLSALARIYNNKGDGDAALDVFNRMLDIDPSSVSAALGLMRLYMERGDSERARQQASILSELCVAKGHRYTCSECGHVSEEYLWQCPQCKRWKTFK